MKRCKCLRYKDLQYLKKDSRIWIYNDEHGLVALECVYPLVDFDCGNAIQICPYYLHIEDGIRVSSAYFNYNKLSDSSKKLIDKAVKNCKNRVDLLEYNFVEERHAIILYIYAHKHEVLVDKNLFETFYEFLPIRQRYLDISSCLSIPPVEHKDRMRCINQCWLRAFEAYLKEIQ